ncbi:hypothetical protein MQE36_08285 [Zhouia spongiae]|uniref:Uncharacterized protein n=1 Tax=Zhouia spongiae TaxID=2202721 RepID=A0ABY3YRW2_9FLAO|nr:hypothetical protein [Zhouia spongiae]UNZ00323.1 hypothetical protein MQE36_08285 [Zhouia spongiae]
MAELIFTGYDRDNNNLLTWFSKKELNIGDEFSIKVVDVLNNSKPENIKPMMVNENIIEQKLKSYKTLKKELEALRLI